MKTLVVYYSKTGTAKKVAQDVIEKMNCDFDELQYDEKTKEMRHLRNPSDYEHIIIIAPVWAMNLAKPVRQYVIKHKTNIRQYDLIVTCGGFGLRGCVKNCLSSIGKVPKNSIKLRKKHVKQGKYDITSIL
ncbi:MAG: hypothetical protein FWD94_01060 [Treponema sp.]|nr:hypothetical protein [Treponema sp.]